SVATRHKGDCTVQINGTEVCEAQGCRIAAANDERFVRTKNKVCEVGSALTLRTPSGACGWAANLCRVVDDWRRSLIRRDRGVVRDQNVVLCDSGERAGLDDGSATHFKGVLNRPIRTNLDAVACCECGG